MKQKRRVVKSYRPKIGRAKKSRIIKAIQALTVFVVMFVVLYVLLKWMTSKDEM